MFNPGDVVRCVDARPTNGMSPGMLVEGAIYRVASCHGEFIRLDTIPGRYAGFHRWRFRLAPDISELRKLLTVQPNLITQEN